MSTSEDIVTRCPQCNTAFRVTLNQLAVADGQVRCGSCLAVFRAVDINAKEDNKATTKQATSSTSDTTDKTDTAAALKANTKLKVDTTPKVAPPKPQTPSQTKNQVEEENPPAQQQAAIKVEAPGEQPSKKLSPQKQETALAPDNTEELLISDEEPGKLDLDGDIFDLDSENKSKKTSLFDRSLNTAKEHKRENADESWAIKMLAELEEEENEENEEKARFIIGSEPSSDNNEFIDEDYEPKIEPSFDLSDSLDIDDDKDDGVAESSEPVGSDYDQIDLNIALEPDITTEQPKDKDSPLYFNEDTTNKETSNSEYNLDSALEDIKEVEATEELASISDDDIENAMHSRARYQDDPGDYLANIEPEPVEMMGLSSSNARRWLWRIGVVFLGLLLVLQIAIIRFDTLSKHPSYRAYYSSACEIIGCTLPSLVDTQQIRTTNLIVRSHPRRQNALVVDAILINNAKFTQPFPALELEFNDINDQLVAKRQLQPDEYLRGELAGAKQMVNNQPIQLSIEIVDPGDSAVNYQLTVVQARAQQ